MQSLWLRQVATANNVQIVAPAEVQFFGMTFSPDGNYIYYVAPKNKSEAAVYQVPVLGGVSRKVMQDVVHQSPFRITAARWFIFGSLRQTGG